MNIYLSMEVNDEILQLYRYIASRSPREIMDNNASSSDMDSMDSITNYHRSDRVTIRMNGMRYKRITRIRSIKV
jgi:hypothetical protein